MKATVKHDKERKWHLLTMWAYWAHRVKRHSLSDAFKIRNEKMSGTVHEVRAWILVDLDDERERLFPQFFDNIAFGSMLFPVVGPQRFVCTKSRGKRVGAKWNR